MDAAKMEEVLSHICDRLGVPTGIVLEERLQFLLLKLDRIAPVIKNRKENAIPVRGNTGVVRQFQKAEPKRVEDPFETDPRRPKWSQATSEFQRKFLDVLHRKYFSKGIKSRVVMIEKSMTSMTTGLVGQMPTEYVEMCLDWAKKKNARGPVIGEEELLTFIESTDKRNEWVRKNRKKFENPNMQVEEEEVLEPDRSKYDD